MKVPHPEPRAATVQISPSKTRLAISAPLRNSAEYCRRTPLVKVLPCPLHRAYNHPMFRIDFPFTDAHLLLTPRFGGLSRWTQVVLLLAILAVLLYFIVRLYRHELRVVPKRFARVLLGLRLALVTLLFLVISLKPAVAH